ncbi:MAG: FkbM family methyltransferase [Rubripirellula sp.]
MIKSLLRNARREFTFRAGGFRPSIERIGEAKYLGSVYGGWPVIPSLIDSNSIVYSFGVGQDISFDLALIELFDCKVQAFDPTPICKNWISQQTLPPNFRFHPVGVAGQDGTIAMYLPLIEGSVSCSEQQTSAVQHSVQVPVQRIETIMRLRNDDHIDILKMDIEGSETGVIDDLAETAVRPTQLLVEFHHRINRSGIATTKRSVDLLRSMGYQLFHVSELGDEFSFVYRSRLR